MKTGYRKERIDRGIKARCDDIYALLSIREIMYLALPRVLPVLLLLSIPFLKFFIGPYWEKVLIITCIISLLSLSWDFLSITGLISLGQALFFGVGGYLTGIFNVRLGLPVFACIPLATISGALLCALFLIPVSRLRGIYFILITLMLPLLLSRVIEATRILGGTSGIGNLSPIPGLWCEPWIPMLALVLCLFGFRRLISGDYGVILKGIKHNELSVMASGINVYQFKAQAILVAGAVGSFAGAYMAHVYQFVGISAFSLDYSIMPVTCVVLGGTGSLAGPVVGAFILVPLSEMLRAFGTLRVVFYSSILIICLLALPEGILHYIQRKYHQFERLVRVE